MLKVGSIIKIHPNYTDKIFCSYNNKENKYLFNRKILNSNFTITSIYPMHINENTYVFDAISHINNQSLIMYSYEVIDITRLLKLKKLMECSK